MEVKIANNKTITVEPGNRGFCSGCGKEIIWAKTQAGKLMPVSELGDGTFVSHFYDCPKAKSFRKK